MDMADLNENHVAPRVPMSEWLRRAIPEAVLRDPLLAAEDAIMLMDIVVALSKKAITIKSIISNGFLGPWLKKAVCDNLKRDIVSVTRDIAILRELLLVNLMTCYRHGQLHGPDVEIRIEIILGMVQGVIDDTVFQHFLKAGAYIKDMANREDCGVAKVRDYAEKERASGHNEIADIVEHLSDLTEDELRNQLLAISEHLLAVRKTSQ